MRKQVMLVHLLDGTMLRAKHVMHVSSPGSAHRAMLPRTWVHVLTEDEHFFEVPASSVSRIEHYTIEDHRGENVTAA